MNSRSSEGAGPSAQWRAAQVDSRTRKVVFGNKFLFIPKRRSRHRAEPDTHGFPPHPGAFDASAITAFLAMTLSDEEGAAMKNLDPLAKRSS